MATDPASAGLVVPTGRDPDRHPSLPSTVQRAPHPAWQWRRLRQGWITYEAPLPGALGMDGGVVCVGRRDPGTGACATCGRKTRLWQATLALPAPFPRALDAQAGGCSRAHATRAVPITWNDVAAAFADFAAGVRADPQPTIWHERLAELRARHARRADWLSRQPAAARRLALTLWANDDTLTLADTEAVVAGVLSGHGPDRYGLTEASRLAAQPQPPTGP